MRYASGMEKMSKAKWEKKPCGCVKTKLQNAGKVLIHCQRHSSREYEGNRLPCYFDEDGLVRLRPGETLPLPRIPKAAPVVEAPVEEFVYFARFNNRIKIGRSNDPERRAKELNADLIGFVSGGRGLERHLHDELREYRERGEWFRAKKPLLARIEELLR
jgi:hypothetical protein